MEDSRTTERSGWSIYRMEEYGTPKKIFKIGLCREEGIYGKTWNAKE